MLGFVCDRVLPWGVLGLGRRGAFAVMAGFVLAATGAPARAYSVCTVEVLEIFAGNDGYVWVTHPQGAFYFDGSVTGRDMMLSLATTAKATGRKVRVRHQTDGASCAGNCCDVEGLWLT